MKCVNCKDEIYLLVESSDGPVYCHETTRDTDCRPIRQATPQCEDVLTVEGRGIECEHVAGHDGAHRRGPTYWDDICDESQHLHRGPWQHVRGSDSLNECMSCGVVHGK